MSTCREVEKEECWFGCGLGQGLGYLSFCPGFHYLAFCPIALCPLAFCPLACCPGFI